MKSFTIDANTAVSKIAYALADVIPIYPITPSSPMAELAEKLSANQEKNLFGNVPTVSQLQSESGVAGALHGAATAGSLTASFTCSQGLLLMIPTLYKLAGERLPCVLHVSARAVASHALSIFGDHSDIMACRQTGAIILASSGVQNAADMAIVAHLVALKLSLPVLHFFDGFRTSHEINKVFLPDEAQLKRLLTKTNFTRSLHDFERRALNPEHPIQRGTSQNEDVFFQNREAANPLYERAEEIIETVMKAVAEVTGRPLSCADYVGSETATDVCVAMGSAADVIGEALENRPNAARGAINLHLFRPFPCRSLLSAIPQTCQTLSVLDRTKESGSVGEPLYLDVCASVQASKRSIRLQGGRYGLGGKEFTPQCVEAIYHNMHAKRPKHPFTVGIVDDVSHTSLPLSNRPFSIDGQYECKLYGYGSDGSVGAVKRLAAAIGDTTSSYVQAFFQYDSKKSGGVTLSQLRFSPTPIRSAYRIEQADFIACTKPDFIIDYSLADELKQGGTLLINLPNGVESCSLFDERSADILRKKHATVYTINADRLAENYALKGKLSTIFQAAFIHILAPDTQKERLLQLIRAEIRKAFAKKGEDVVGRNLALLDAATAALHKIALPTEYCAKPSNNEQKGKRGGFFAKVAQPILLRKGNDLPVSAFTDDGSVPTDTAKLEKRGITFNLPRWNESNCIQCTKCAFSCPHTTIRAALVKENTVLPKGFRTANALQAKGYRFHIQVYPLDCTGCGVCLNVCPVNEKERKKAYTENRVPDESRFALTVDRSEQYRREETRNMQFNATLPPPNVQLTEKMTSVKRTALSQQYFEFSGACAGCGETPYLKALTALLGNRLIIANATGCSSIYGGTYPICPYAKDSDGRGPAWANSLFENNAEFAYGIRLAYDARRTALKTALRQFFSEKRGRAPKVYRDWLANEKSPDAADSLRRYLLQFQSNKRVKEILKHEDCLCEKSVWCVGGDGWAYDIGFGGVDHILSGNANVKMLVLDTEVYSNTGGQQSKATPLGASVKFAENGKTTPKKPLAKMMALYHNVYVAQCSLGADGAQFLKAVEEADAHDGPALIVCYAPCISHGYDLALSAHHQKQAADCGYAPLARYKDGEWIEDGRYDESQQAEFFGSELRFVTKCKKKKENQ